MEKRPTSHQVLEALASGQVLSPQRIATKMCMQNQTVRNILVHLRGLRYVESIGYAQYKITELGLKLFKQLQPSKFQDLGGTQ